MFKYGLSQWVVVAHIILFDTIAQWLVPIFNLMSDFIQNRVLMDPN